MITVLMPTYNCAEYISDAINSILSQTFRDFEFLIIDDGSTDDSERIIKSFKDTRINFLKIAHVGKSEALNRGLRLANRDIIVHMDADDIAHYDLIKKQINLYRSRNSNYWIGCNYAVFDNRSKKICYLIINPKEDKEIRNGFALHGRLIHAGSIVNRENILSLGGYKSLEAFEDYEFWLRGMGNFTYENNQEILYFARFRKDSRSREGLKQKHLLHYQIQAEYFNKSLVHSFNIVDSSEEKIIRGWREYFYGNKIEARKFWKYKFLLTNWKVFLAFIFTFLPERIFVEIKELRLRYRVKYFINYFKKENRILRINLKTQQNQYGKIY